MKKIHLIFIALLTVGTSLNAQWYELVTPTIDYDIKNNSFIDLEINLDGEPCLLYNTVVPDEGNKLFVQKYNAENEEWSLLGSEHVNELNASDNHLAIDSKGIIYVAFLKLGIYERGSWCTVMKFDGTEWVQIGDWNAGIVMSDVTLYCNNQDDVFVSYFDVDTYSGVVVKKYLGTESNWETLGDEPFLPSGQCLLPELTTDNNGNLLVSFGDGSSGLFFSVMKFNGTSWEYVGNPGFWDEPNYPTSIIVGKNNEVYATTTDFWGLGSTVLNYKNNAWSSQYSTSDAGYMPFARYSDEVYLGLRVTDNGSSRPRIKKVDDSGNWVDLAEQPGPYFTLPYYNPVTHFDIEADNYGNLYLAMMKGDQWNSHLSVLKLDVITGVAESQDKTITIFPNPTDGKIKINSPSGEQIQDVLIVDITGKLVFQQNSPRQTLDLSDLKKGVYFIRINTSKNNYIEKLLIR